MRAHDVFGLVSHRVAHEVAPTNPRPGHQKWAPANLVLEQQPTFIFHCYSLHTQPETGGLCGEAPTFLARGYEPCTLFVPGARREDLFNVQELAVDAATRPGMYYTFVKRVNRAFPCLERKIAE